MSENPGRGFPTGRPGAQAEAHGVALRTSRGGRLLSDQLSGLQDARFASFVRNARPKQAGGCWQVQVSEPGEATRSAPCGATAVQVTLSVGQS